MAFHKDILKLDPAAVTEELADKLCHDVRQTLRRAIPAHPAIGYS
jgi:hypothetical protein